CPFRWPGIVGCVEAEGRNASGGAGSGADAFRCASRILRRLRCLQERSPDREPALIETKNPKAFSLPANHQSKPHRPPVGFVPLPLKPPDPPTESSRRDQLPQVLAPAPHRWRARRGLAIASASPQSPPWPLSGNSLG